MSNVFKLMYVLGNHNKNSSKVFYRCRLDYSEILQKGKETRIDVFKERIIKWEEYFHPVLRPFFNISFLFF